jgi:hypothetical protein
MPLLSVTLSYLFHPFTSDTRPTVSETKSAAVQKVNERLHRVILPVHSLLFLT